MIGKLSATRPTTGLVSLIQSGRKFHIDQIPHSHNSGPDPMAKPIIKALKEQYPALWKKCKSAKQFMASLYTVLKNETVSCPSSKCKAKAILDNLAQNPKIKEEIETLKDVLNI